MPGMPLVAAALILVLALPASAQPPANAERSVTAVRLDPAERMVLDGRLTEAAWRRAAPADGFVQQDRNTGDPATEVRVDSRNGVRPHYADCKCADPRSQTRAPPATSASECTRTSGEKYQFARMSVGVRSTMT